MQKTFNTRIKQKRDTASNWESKNPLLLDGEIILVDTAAGELRAKIGDGSKNYSQLPFTDEPIKTLINNKSKVTATANGSSGNLVGTINVDGTTVKFYSPVQTTITGNAATASKLKTARTISLGGNASGSASFDGSDDITINATVNQAANATKATNDSEGNKITSTYIKDIAVSDKTITYTKGDNTTDSVTVDADSVDFTQTQTSGAAIGTISINGNDTVLYAPTYSLPIATSSVLGGIKSGGDITISNTGIVGVNNDSHNHGNSTITSVDASKISSGTINAARIPNISLDKLVAGTTNKTIPSSLLPGYVDDVLEYNGKDNFPLTGESGKIYVDISTNLSYRWGGSAYVEVSPSLALGETSSTAYRGDLGAAAYKHAVTNKGKAYGSGLYKVTTNGEGHVTDAVEVTKADITALGIPSTNTTYGVATSSANGLMSSGDKGKLDGIAAGAEVNQNAFAKVVVGNKTIAADNKSDSITLAAGSNVTLTPDDANDKVTIAAKDTTYSAGTGISLSGTTINHSNSVTAGTAKGDDSKTLAFGGTFTIPTIAYDGQGHITSKGTTTMTMPNNPNSDTKVNVTLGTTTKAYLLGISTAPTASAQALTAISDTGVYLDTTAGKLTAGSFAGNGSGLTSLNASNISSGTIAAARLPAASTSAQGAMTAAMVTKLNGITESADAVSFTCSLTSGTKVGTITINGTGTDLYAPTNTDTHYTTGLKVADSATATANAAATNGNVRINVLDNTTVRDSHIIKGTGATTVTSDANGVITINSTNTTYGAASSSAAGLMSAADKGKLDGIAAGANKTVVDSSLSNSSTNPVQNKIINAALNQRARSQTLTNQDLNSVTNPGFYNAGGGNTVANKPTGFDNFGLIVVHNASGAYYTQIIFNSGSSYRRHCSNGTWTGWTLDKFTDTTYNAASGSAAGLMSAADKNKLDGITASADTVAFSAAATSGNKVGVITINGTATNMFSPTQTTVSGNAGTATKLQTARKISIASAAGTTGTNFDGTGNISLVAPTTMTNFSKMESDSFVVQDKVTLAYDTTNECLNFVFA